MVILHSEESAALLHKNSEKGMLSYSDRYGDVVYRQLKTFEASDNSQQHQTDNTALNYFAVFTKAEHETNFKFCGIVSSLYRFEGHDVLNSLIRNSINETGNPLISELNIFSKGVAIMRSEFIIRNAISTPQVGDIYPVIFTFNTYNGSGSQGVSYGLSLKGENKYNSFSFTLGSIRTIHTKGAKTRISSSTSNYMQIFSENIGEVIEKNFETQLDDEVVLKTLDFIEKIGKKKRNEVSEFLQKIMEQNQTRDRKVTAWQMFLAIMKCINITGNINAKRILENAAERVLVMPERMEEALKSMQF